MTPSIWLMLEIHSLELPLILYFDVFAFFVFSPTLEVSKQLTLNSMWYGTTLQLEVRERIIPLQTEHTPTLITQGRSSQEDHSSPTLSFVCGENGKGKTGGLRMGRAEVEPPSATSVPSELFLSLTVLPSLRSEFPFILPSKHAPAPFLS